MRGDKERGEGLGGAGSGWRGYARSERLRKERRTEGRGRMTDLSEGLMRRRVNIFVVRRIFVRSLFQLTSSD